MRKSIKINYNKKSYQTFINNNKIHFLRVEKIDGIDHFFNLNFNEYLILNKKYNEMKTTLYNIDNKVLKENILKFKLGVLGLVILPGYLELFKLSSNIVLEKNNLNSKIEINLPSSIDEISDDYSIKDNTVIIYNNDGLDLFLGYNNITFDELRKTLNENRNLNEIYRSFVSSYIDELEVKMPNVDLRCFNENLKLLKITDVTSEEMLNETGSSKCNGYFKPATHDILILNSLFEDKYCSVVTHELTHMLNNLIIEKDGKTIIRRSFTNNMELYISEGFNEYINTYLFNYNINSCSYREQVNDVEIFIEIFGKDIVDEYLNGNASYLKKRLELSLGTDATNDLFVTMATEVISLDDSSLVLDSSTIVNKYDLLMKCYLDNKNNNLNSTEIQIMKQLFSDSTSIYEYETFNMDEFYGLNTEIENIVNERIDAYLLKNNCNNLIDIKLDNKSLGKYDLSKLYMLIDQDDEFKIVCLETNDSGVVVKDIMTGIQESNLDNSSFKKIDFIDFNESNEVDINILYEECNENFAQSKTR